MGNQKLKWTTEEEEALKAGVAKHGTGKWKNILVDAEFAPTLSNRSNVDLKDKWRNMGAANGQGCRDKSSTPKTKATAPNDVTKTQYNSSVSSSKEKTKHNPPRSTQDGKNAPKYNVMILDALSSLKDPRGSDTGAIARFIEQKYGVLPNCRRLLSSKLSRLVVQGKLEKVLQCYKIKEAELGTKTPSPKQKDVRPRPLQQASSIVFIETLEDAASTAAYWIAEAENKAFVTSEALKESERVSQMAEDANTMLTLCKGFFELCSGGEYIIMD